MELFEKDPYLKEWESEVVSVEKRPDGNFVKLKETAFHPQGGGQPGDVGLISSSGSPTRVIDTIFSNGKILSKVEGFPPSGRVKCSIDWPRRYRLMKTHSGEHLLVGSILKVVPELEIEKVTIGELKGKIFARGEATLEEILAAEKKANTVISEGRPIAHSAEELANAKSKFPDLRIKEERVRGSLRVMEIQDYDAAACSGTHVRNAKEIGLVKITKAGVGNNRIEISFAVGEKAKEAAFELANEALRAAAAIQSETDKVASTVGNMKKELKELKRRLYEKSKASKMPELVDTKYGKGCVAFLPEVERVHGIKLAKKLLKEKCFVILAGGTIKPWFIAARSGGKAPVEAFAKRLGFYGGRDNFFSGSPKEGFEEELKKLERELNPTGR